MKKLGFGCMRFPLLDENDPKSIDLEQVERMFDIFLEKGFLYFQNRVYGRCLVIDFASK